MGCNYSSMPQHQWQFKLELECLRIPPTLHPMITHTIDQFILDPNVKTRQSQSYTFKEFAKTSIFLILKNDLHKTNFLKLIDKMCKYEMDRASIVEYTEWTRFCPHTDGRTNGQTRWNQYNPLQFRWVEGIINGVGKVGIQTNNHLLHRLLTCQYSDVIMGMMASQITSLMIVYWTFYSGVDQRKHQKLSVTGLCEGNSPVTGEFPAQRSSNSENVSIWWRHHVLWIHSLRESATVIWTITILDVANLVLRTMIVHWWLVLLKDMILAKVVNNHLI